MLSCFVEVWRYFRRQTWRDITRDVSRYPLTAVWVSRTDLPSSAARRKMPRWTSATLRSASNIERRSSVTELPVYSFPTHTGANVARAQESKEAMSPKIKCIAHNKWSQLKRSLDTSYRRLLLSSQLKGSLLQNASMARFQCEIVNNHRYSISNYRQ